MLLFAGEGGGHRLICLSASLGFWIDFVCMVFKGYFCSDSGTGGHSCLNHRGTHLVKAITKDHKLCPALFGVQPECNDLL